MLACCSNPSTASWISMGFVNAGGCFSCAGIVFGVGAFISSAIVTGGALKG